MGKTLKITAPNKQFNGVSAGVRFVDGVATISADDEAPLNYFTQAGFDVAGHTETPTIEQGHKYTAAELKKLDRADLDAVGIQVGLHSPEYNSKPDLADAILKAQGELAGKTATEKQAGIEAPSGADVAGDGPAGPVHNEGQDGANPDGDQPQGTPNDNNGI